MPSEVTTQRMFHIDARESRRLRADADDEVVELVAFVAGHDRVAVDDALGSNDFHSLTLACRLDAPAHGEDDLFLALHHAREVHLGLGHADAERRGVADLAQQVGTGEQRLGGDASPVQACPTQLGALDDGHLRTELCCTKRGNIAGGSTAEHHDALGHAEVCVVAGTAAADSPSDGSRPRRDVANASVTMRSCSSWCEPAYPSDGLARRGLPM